MDDSSCYGAMSHPTLWWMCQHNLQRTQCHRCFADRELDLLVFGRFFRGANELKRDRDRDRMDDIHPHEHGVSHYNAIAHKRIRGHHDGVPEHKSADDRPPLHPVLRKSVSGLFYTHNPHVVPEYGGYLADDDADDDPLEL